VLVLATDFSKVVSDFDTKSSVPPEQLAWCGADAVVLYWPEILLMVGPFGDWIKYSYGGVRSLFSMKMLKMLFTFHFSTCIIYHFVFQSAFEAHISIRIIHLCRLQKYPPRSRVGRLLLRGTLRADSPAKLTSELDGLRVLTSTRHEFICRVPDARVDVFAIGSTTAGSVNLSPSLQFVHIYLPTGVFNLRRIHQPFPTRKE
jgi:hypothetical protein